MGKISPSRLFVLIFLLSLPCASSYGQMRIGELATVSIETLHPYPDGAVARPVVWSYTLHHPGAAFLKVHFSAFAVDGWVENGSPQGDYVVIRDQDGAVQEVLSGVLAGDLWARSVPGDTAIIVLHADEVSSAFGLMIDQYGYGTVPLYPDIRQQANVTESRKSRSDLPTFEESICGNNDKTSICDAAVMERVRIADPVGRLLFAGDCGGLFVCTGFLVAPDGLFLTTAHCANSPREARSMEVWFNFISGGGDRDEMPLPSCALPDRPNPDVFRAARFVKADCNLDAALHQLADPVKGNPADIYGHLTLSSRSPVAGEMVWVPQHPGGRRKEIAEANATVSSAALEGLNFCADRPGCGIAPDPATGVFTEFGYTADTEPGSSGSPILDENNLVIGLHHAGGCRVVGGENSGILSAPLLALLSEAPQARFTTDPRKRNGRLPFTLTFDATSSFDPDGGDIVAYHWDFGDGSPVVTGPQVMVMHTYRQNGTFRVFLWVIDDEGMQSEKAATRQVIVRQPRKRPSP